MIDAWVAGKTHTPTLLPPTMKVATTAAPIVVGYAVEEVQIVESFDGLDTISSPLLKGQADLDVMVACTTASTC